VQALLPPQQRHPIDKDGCQRCLPCVAIRQALATLTSLEASLDAWETRRLLSGPYDDRSVQWACMPQALLILNHSHITGQQHRSLRGQLFFAAWQGNVLPCGLLCMRWHAATLVVLYTCCTWLQGSTPLHCSWRRRSVADVFPESGQAAPSPQWMWQSLAASHL
jgi:hypothetical protein